MLVPSQRLLWLAALAVLPLASIAGLVSGAALPCAIAIAALSLLAAFDATRAHELLATISASAPKFLRLTKDVPALLPLKVENEIGRAHV